MPAPVHPAESPAAAADAGGAVPTDAVVIGAGPVGLFQVFELGLLDLRAHVIDALPEAGGQCVALYADKPIYDIPGTPVCTGRELIDRLLRQVAPFAPQFHLAQVVDGLQQQTDGRFLVTTHSGTRLLAKVVVVAGGVGAFQPRRLAVDGLAEFEGTQVFHGSAQAGGFAGKQLLIVGDGQDALEQALLHAESGPDRAVRVTLMHRRDDFKGDPQTLRRMREAVAGGALELLIAQITGLECAQGRLHAVHVLAADGASRRVPLDALLVSMGLSPKLGPIAEWGLAMERKQLVVDTERFETNVAGIFAVGDVNTYPGKQKLILCGFHEATLAAFAAARHAYPMRPVRLEYTTTSTRLHKALRLDVAG